MFRQARLNLTLMYLLIIMTISLSFSAFIYQSVTKEFRTRLDVIERRLMQERNPMTAGQLQFFIDDLDDTKTAVFFVLMYTNGVILLFSGIAGYFLAGKTLRPIEETMDEQKRFIADASHELKTPLTSMLTNIEVTLRAKNLTVKDARSTLEETLDDLKSISALTNNLLTLARREENGGESKKAKLNLSEVIEKSIKVTTPMAKRKKIKIVYKPEKVKVKGNFEELEKLFNIILDNAIKYSENGKTVQIKVTKHRRSVSISIADRGKGIAKKDLPHIFDRFFRADEARSRGSHHGFGLGLSLAKKIVEDHYGKITVKSKAGTGSTFTVTLPL